MSKSVQFAGFYDGELCVPALFAGAAKKVNINVVMANSVVLTTNRIADALIAGGQFTLVEDFGPDLPIGGVTPTEDSGTGGTVDATAEPAGGDAAGSNGQSGGGQADGQAQTGGEATGSDGGQAGSDGSDGSAESNPSGDGTDTASAKGKKTKAS